MNGEGPLEFDGQGELHPNCEWGYGTASHVAGAFGLAAAGEALRLALLPKE